MADFNRCFEHVGCECKCVSQSCVYGQSLTEMDFTRGVWTAAMDGEIGKVMSYLDKGGDPNVIDSSGYTALHYASSSGHGDICEALLSNGASANVQTRSGHDTPLHRAAYRGHLGTVKRLLKHGGNAMLCNTDGQTALHKAAEKSHREIIQLLIKRNPELVHVKDIRDRKALDLIPENRVDLKNMF